MPHFLRKTHGSWSAGTRVEIVDWLGSTSPFEVEEGTLVVRVMANDKPEITVPESDVVERGKKS